MYPINHYYFEVKEKFSARGLSDKDVADSRQKHGENVLTPPKKTSLWRLYLEKYNDPIIKILLVAAAISLGLAVIENDYVEAIGIFIAIFFATTVGFYFERDAAKRFDELTALGEEQPVKVLRCDRVVEIPRREVVVGDVVLLGVGDEVPADGRLFEATDLQIDESALTGEPIISKFVEVRNDGATYPSNIVLRSTMVMNGSGRMRVTAVGDSTEIGKVARKTRETIILCEAAGFDKIFVETVGVGQSETACHSMVDFFLLLQVAGTGDELQGIKRGIMEISDGIVINKCDGENVDRCHMAATNYRNALHFFPKPESGWLPKVLCYSGFYGTGVKEVWDMIYEYIDFVKHNGYFQYRRNEQSKYWMYETINEQLHRSFYNNPEIKVMMKNAERAVLNGEKTSFAAAGELLDHYFS